MNLPLCKRTEFATTLCDMQYPLAVLLDLSLQRLPDGHGSRRGGAVRRDDRRLHAVPRRLLYLLQHRHQRHLHSQPRHVREKEEARGSQSQSYAGKKDLYLFITVTEASNMTSLKPLAAITRQH